MYLNSVLSYPYFAARHEGVWREVFYATSWPEVEDWILQGMIVQINQTDDLSVYAPALDPWVQAIEQSDLPRAVQHGKIASRGQFAFVGGSTDVKNKKHTGQKANNSDPWETTFAGLWKGKVNLRLGQASTEKAKLNHRGKP